jgi:integrase
MIRTAWSLGARPELADLRLRAWAHMLGFRGHFSTKSRRYSTTLGALRDARADWRRAQATPPVPQDGETTLPLPEFCLKALHMRRAQQTGDRKAAGDLWQDTRGLIFTTKYGTPIEPGNLTRMFALRARRAGLRVIPLRNTRHTCSSLLVALKVHPKVARRILRHSQIAMTMEVYAEASEEQVRAALGRLSAAMGGSGTETGSDTG